MNKTITQELFRLFVIGYQLSVVGEAEKYFDYLNI